MDANTFAQTDLDLLGREFEVDPFAIPDLADEIPKGSPRPEILARYNPHGGPKVRCAVCGRACHWKGYLVELVDGRRALVAERQCGRDAFGFAWEQVATNFRRAVDRKFDLERLVRIRPFLDPAALEAAGLSTGEDARGFDAFLERLRREHGPLSQHLARAARNGGALIVTRNVRDRAAEEDNARHTVGWLVADVEEATSIAARRQAKARLEAWIEAHGRRYRTEPVTLGLCGGSDALMANPSPSKILSRAAAQFSRASEIASSGAQGEALRAALSAAEDGLRDVATAIDLLGAIEAFLAPSNLALIGKLADHLSLRLVNTPLLPGATIARPEAPAAEALRTAFRGRV